MTQEVSGASEGLSQDLLSNVKSEEAEFHSLAEDFHKASKAHDHMKQILELVEGRSEEEAVVHSPVQHGDDTSQTYVPSVVPNSRDTSRDFIEYDRMKDKLELIEARLDEERRCRTVFCSDVKQDVQNMKQLIDRELSNCEIALASVQNLQEKTSAESKCHAEEAALQGFKHMVEKMEDRDEELKRLLRVMISQKQEEFAERWRFEIQESLAAMAINTEDSIKAAWTEIEIKTKEAVGKAVGQELELKFGKTFKQIQEEVRLLQTQNGSSKEPSAKDVELSADDGGTCIDAELAQLKREVLEGRNKVQKMKNAVPEKSLGRAKRNPEECRSSVEDAPEPVHESQNTKSVLDLAQLQAEVSKLQRDIARRAQEYHAVDELVQKKLAPNLEALAKEVQTAVGATSQLETKMERERTDRKKEIQKLTEQLDEYVIVKTSEERNKEIEKLATQLEEYSHSAWRKTGHVAVDDERNAKSACTQTGHTLAAQDDEQEGRQVCISRPEQGDSPPSKAAKKIVSEPAGFLTEESSKLRRELIKVRVPVQSQDDSGSSKVKGEEKVSEEVSALREESTRLRKELENLQVCNKLADELQNSSAAKKVAARAGSRAATPEVVSRAYGRSESPFQVTPSGSGSLSLPARDVGSAMSWKPGMVVPHPSVTAQGKPRGRPMPQHGTRSPSPVATPILSGYPLGTAPLQLVQHNMAHSWAVSGPAMSRNPSNEPAHLIRR